MKCFTCRTRETTGNSAYCAVCQPAPRWTHLRGFNQCGCSVCGNAFATLNDFDKHRNTVNDQTVCLDPVGMGLELRDDVWGTPEGNAQRDRKAAQISRFPGNIGGRSRR